jgi:hypothetical protein
MLSKINKYSLQEVTQSAGTTPNETEVTNSNPSPLLVKICQKIIIINIYIYLSVTSFLFLH